jgi:aminodeoxyfutalosine synthase
MLSILEDVGALLTSGRAPTLDQVRTLASVGDLVRIGMLGDEARRARHGAAATFVRVADVAADAAQSATWPDLVGEVRVTGEASSPDEAVDLARAVVDRAGGRPVTAWSLDVLVRLTTGDAALVDLAGRLRDAGVAAVADAPLDRLAEPVRAVAALCKAELPVARFTVHRPADLEGSLQRLALVKALQQATGAVRAFAPLARMPDTQAPSTGYDDVRLVALARLWLDCVPSIQVDWQLHGPKLAQVALLFGADDLDAVPAAGDDSAGRRRAPLEEVRRNIVAASLSPVERDGRWAVIPA